MLRNECWLLLWKNSLKTHLCNANLALLDLPVLFNLMLYHDRLHPWCIIQLLPNSRTIIVHRFRRRNDADAYMKVLCRMNPDAIYQIMFDAQQGNS